MIMEWTFWMALSDAASWDRHIKRFTHKQKEREMAWERTIEKSSQRAAQHTSCHGRNGFQSQTATNRFTSFTQSSSSKSKTAKTSQFFLSFFSHTPPHGTKTGHTAGPTSRWRSNMITKKVRVSLPPLSDLTQLYWQYLVHICCAFLLLSSLLIWREKKSELDLVIFNDDCITVLSALLFNLYHIILLYGRWRIQEVCHWVNDWVSRNLTCDNHGGDDDNILCLIVGHVPWKCCPFAGE